MNPTQPSQQDPQLAAEVDLERYGEFLLAGEITPEGAARLSQKMLRFAYAERDAAQKSPLVLTLFSVGGNLDAGFHIAATLMRIRELGLEVHTRIQGGAYSTAFLVAQFGTHRFMDSTAIAHIHTIQFTVERQAETIIFEDHADRIAKRKSIMAQALASRNTGGEPFNRPEYWIDNFMQGREHHLTAQECLSMGLIDEIVGEFDLLRPLSQPQPRIVAATTLELLEEQLASNSAA